MINTNFQTRAEYSEQIESYELKIKMMLLEWNFFQATIHPPFIILFIQFKWLDDHCGPNKMEAYFQKLIPSWKKIQ